MDSDDGFRARVLGSLADGEVDTAGELFLSRPTGWRAELDLMATRRDARVGAEEEQRQEQALRRELDRAEARMAELDELARRGAAESAAINQELAEVRRSRRALADDLLASEARCEAAEKATAEATRRADDAEGALSARERELDELRGRVERLEAELDRRPPAPEDAAPTVDAGDLGRRLDQLREAAVGIDTALDAAEALLPPPPPPSSPTRGRPEEASSGARPARRRPSPLPGGVRDDSVEAARHLVGTDGMVLAVDGYNVSMLAWPDGALADQRDRLVARLDALAARTGVEPVVVFDGAAGHGPALGRPRQQVRIRFSAEGVEADDEILEMIDRHPVGQPMTVVSNDHRVADGARARGANVMTSTVLLQLF